MWQAVPRGRPLYAKPVETNYCSPDMLLLQLLTTTCPPCAEHAERGELTYVHCKAGRGRSTTLVICYLVRQMQMSPEAAYEFVRTKRPQVCLAEGQWAAVREVRLILLLSVRDGALSRCRIQHACSG